MKNGELLRDFFVTKCCEAKKKSLLLNLLAPAAPWLYHPSCLPPSRFQAASPRPSRTYSGSPSLPAVDSSLPAVDRHTVPEG